MHRGEAVEAGRFEELYERHAVAVHRYVRSRIRDPHLVEDIVQETFVRVFRFVDRLDPDRPAWPWIKAIASTMCSNAVRGRRHQAEVLVDDVGPVVDLTVLAGPATAPEAHCLRVEERHRVAGVLGRLPHRQRTMLVLKEIDDLSCSEIASLEGTSSQVVKAALARARAAFRRLHALPAAFAVRRRLRHRLPELNLVGVANVVVAERLVPGLGALVVAASAAWAAAPSTGLTVHPSAMSAPVSTTWSEAGAPTSAATSGDAARTAGPRRPLAPHAAIPSHARTVEVKVAPTASSGAAAVVTREVDDELTFDGMLLARFGEEEPYAGGVGSLRCDGELRRHVCRLASEAPENPSFP